MRVLGAIQYLSCLFLAVLYFAYSAWAAKAGGVSAYGLCVLFLPLLLGGYISGLSFFMPRVVAVAALAFVALFFVLRFFDPFHGTMSVDSFVVIASIVPVVVSIVGLLWHDSSAWRRSKTMLGRIAIATIAGVPAIIATLWIVAFLLGLRAGSSHRAT
jgi:hypothetical protein